MSKGRKRRSGQDAPVGPLCRAIASLMHERYEDGKKGDVERAQRQRGERQKKLS
jgi:hypothetical protein